MFKDAKTFSSYSVDDVSRAKAFYADTLGLETSEEMGGLGLRLGGGEAYLYPKDDHQPATFTVLNFRVDDIDAAVDELTEKGVAFEQYGGAIATDERGIARDSGGPAIAWFKDPAGNILSVVQV